MYLSTLPYLTQEVKDLDAEKLPSRQELFNRFFGFGD